MIISYNNILINRKIKKEAFMEAAKALITPNVKQQECIQSIKGPVLVLAGPGTGKTFTIIRRIEYMLSNGIEPSSILCMTYSAAAANEMKAQQLLLSRLIHTTPLLMKL